MVLEQLSASDPNNLIVLVQDHAPAPARPGGRGNLRLLPPYSPERNPVGRCFLEVRWALANRLFETVETLQQAITGVPERY